jgi:hypothetical protein
MDSTIIGVKFNMDLAKIADRMVRRANTANQEREVAPCKSETFIDLDNLDNRSHTETIDRQHYGGEPGPERGSLDFADVLLYTEETDIKPEDLLRLIPEIMDS